MRHAVLVILVACSSALQAQGYPSKPIRMVVPFAGGGSGVDYAAQLFKSKLADALGQPVVIDNRAGANGMIGSANVARSAPDGYTILFTTPSTHITAVYLSKHVPYDPVKDFTPLSASVEPVSAIAVNPQVPATNVKELVEYARRNPGKLSYSSSGIGSVFHLTGELMKQMAGIDLLHVPYKGSIRSLTDLQSGQISMTLSAVSPQIPHHRAGKMRIIAVLENQRFSGLPDVPTVGESLPGFEKPASWFGFFGPAGMQPAVVHRLGTEMARMVTAPDILPKLEEGGYAAIGNSPQEFAALIKAGFDVYGRAVKAAGLKPE
jgi:tripartite-type tricarboxylate transporter receptor subunit TctC